MIFQFKEGFLIPLAYMAGFWVLILGVMWLVFGVYEAKRRGSVKERKVEDWDFKLTKFLKVITYLGMVVGVLSLLSGVSGLLYNVPPSAAFADNAPGPSVFTSVLLIILGVLTFLKPMNDIPIASVIGLLAGSAVVAVVAMAIPGEAYELIGIWIDPTIFFVILFIIVFAIVALTAKFYIGTLMGISKLVSWPFFALIIAGFCFLQAFLLLVPGISISGIF
ncbi:MAG: hypothetical protein ACFE96_01550 [Candidatus Hermodarchaeota archaeon]